MYSITAVMAIHGESIVALLFGCSWVGLLVGRKSVKMQRERDFQFGVE